MKNLQRFRKTILLFLRTIQLTAFILTFYYIMFEYYSHATLFYWGNVLLVVSYAFMLLIFTLVYGGVRVGVLRLPELIFSMLLALVFSNILMYIQLSLTAQQLLDPIPMLYLLLLQFVEVLIFSIISNKVYFKIYTARTVAIVYNNYNSAMLFAKKIELARDKYKLGEMISQEDGIKKVFSIIDKYNSIMLIDLDTRFREAILNYCYDLNKRVYIVPDVSDVFVRSSHSTQVFDTPVLLCKNRAMSIEQRIIKRTMDILMSGIGLLIASPFMIIIAISIKLYDRGPVFFTQPRMTRGHRIFTVYKFRSMVVDAEKDTGAVLMGKSDDRITPIGKIIRKLRVDELPQLINILKGDMSIVGPRPERPELFEQYTDALPEFKYRLKVKAGLTGLAQIMGQYNTSPKDKLLFDLMYIEDFSILQDIKLIFMTFKILFLARSTEGINEDQTTALQPSEVNNNSEKNSDTDTNLNNK